MLRLRSALSPARATVAIAASLALVVTGVGTSIASVAAAPRVVVADVIAAPQDAAPDITVNGTITGTVKSVKGVAIAGATVSAYGYDLDDWEPLETPSFTAVTAANGSYSLSVAPGTYSIKFSAPTTGKPLWVDEYWKDAADFWSARDITVDELQTVSKINGTLAATSYITGTVTGPAGALTADERASLTLTACEGDIEDGDFYVFDECVGRATIAADGSYVLGGFGAGRYTVFASTGGSSNLLSTYYPSSRYAWSSTSFTVKAGATVKSKNFALGEGAVISGAVLTEAGDAVSGADVEASIHAEDEEWGGVYSDVVARVVTDATGHYSVRGLWPGDYTVHANDVSVAGRLHSGEWFDNTYTESKATVLPLGAFDSTATADFELAASATAAGVVTIDGTDDAAVGAGVEFYRFTTTRNKNTELVASTVVNAQGEYSVSGLVPGHYVVLVTPTEDQLSYVAHYQGAPSSGSIQDATILPFTAGADVVLPLTAIVGGSYTGTVEGIDGPLANAIVTLDGTDWWSFPGGDDDDEDVDAEYGQAITDDDGRFTISGVPAGDHTLTVEASYFFEEGGPEATVYLAKEVVAPPVADGALPTDLGTITLEQANRLSGVITGPNGKPIAWGEVSAEVRLADGTLQDADYADTDSRGRYVFESLPQGSIYVSVSSRYPDQYIGGSDDASMSTPVVFTSTGQRRTQDISLFAGGSISGTVRDAVTGRTLSGIQVSGTKRPLEASVPLEDLLDPDTGAITSKKGTYTLPGLTPGSYNLDYTPQRLDFEGSPYLTATKKAYLAGTAGVTQNASLVKGTKVTGTVTTGGEPAPFVLVIAYPFDSEVFDPYVEPENGYAVAITDPDGNYTLHAAPGKYIVQFIDIFGGFGSSFLGGVSTPAASTPLIVTTAAQSGVDGVIKTYSGSVTATLAGDYDESASSVVQLTRRPLGGGPESTTTYFSEEESEDVFPIGNLDDGEYDIVVNAYDDRAGFDGYEGSFTIDADHRAIDLGELDLGERQPIEWIVSGNNGARPSVSPTTPVVGDLLTVDNGGWTEDITGFGYQWLRNGKPIIGALAQSYAVQPGDAGKKLSVRLIPHDETDVLFAETTVSNETDAVAKGAPANELVAPTVTGTTRVGQTLTVQNGEWDLPGLAFSYSWVRTTGGVEKVVGTSASYKLTTADVATGVTARVTASRPGFTSKTVDVPVTGVQPATALAQTAKSAITLVPGGYTVSNGTWKPSGATFTYQWLANGSPIDGATSATLDPAPEGVISVIITAAKTGFAPTSIEYSTMGLGWLSQPTLAAGWSNQVGRAVSVDLSNAETTPAATSYRIQWLANGKAITGATTATYTPTKVGQVITVNITGVRGTTVSGAPAILELGTTSPAGGVIDVSGSLSTETANVGRPITAMIDSASPTPTSVTWKWFRSTGGSDPVAIAKATKASYTPTSSDVGSVLSVIGTVQRAGYTKNSLTLQSSPVIATAAANTASPTLPLAITVGTKVSAKAGTWDLPGATFSYQWAINGVEVGGATFATYTPRPEDADEALTVTVTAVKTGLPDSAAVTSNAVVVQLGAAPTAKKAAKVTVGGKAVTSATSAKTLTSTSPTWSATGVATGVEWQTLVGGTWVAVDGQSSSTLDLAALEASVGSKYRAKLSGARAGYATGITYTPVVTVK